MKTDEWMNVSNKVHSGPYVCIYGNYIYVCIYIY